MLVIVCNINNLGLLLLFPWRKLKLNSSPSNLHQQAPRLNLSLFFVIDASLLCCLVFVKNLQANACVTTAGFWNHLWCVPLFLGSDFAPWVGLVLPFRTWILKYDGEEFFWVYCIRIRDWLVQINRESCSGERRLDSQRGENYAIIQWLRGATFITERNR